MVTLPAAASAQSEAPSANGAVVVDGGAVPDEALEAPADLTDATDTDGDGLTDTEETSGPATPGPAASWGWPPRVTPPMPPTTTATTTA